MQLNISLTPFLKAMYEPLEVLGEARIPQLELLVLSVIVESPLIRQRDIAKELGGIVSKQSVAISCNRLLTKYPVPLLRIAKRETEGLVPCYVATIEGEEVVARMLKGVREGIRLE